METKVEKAVIEGPSVAWATVATNRAGRTVRFLCGDAYQAHALMIVMDATAMEFYVDEDPPVDAGQTTDEEPQA